MRRATRRSSSTVNEGDKQERKKRCCTVPIVILSLIVVATIGGILLWQLLPDSSKQHVQNVIDGGASVPDVGLPGIGNNDPETTYVFNQCSDNATECCNGVESICGLRVNDILYASLHNAMATVEDGFVFAGNHEFQLEAALDAGYRGINLDVGKCDGEIKFIHGKCSLGGRNPALVFGNINRFLKNNPNEVIIMPLQFVDDQEETATLEELYNIMLTVDGFTDRMYWYFNETLKWPTLRTLIEDDKRILVFHYNNPEGPCNQAACPPGFHDWFRFAAESEFSFENVEAFKDTSRSCAITRGDGGYRDFFGLNAFVSTPLPSKKAAEEIHAKEVLQNHIAECSSLNDLDVNLVFVDFWSEGDLVEVTQLHNIELGLANDRRKKKRALRKRLGA